MYQFRISTKAPFWARNNDNKPNSVLFNKWLNDNMREVNNLPIHFINFLNITINSEYNGIKYIEIKNTNEPNDIRYYYIDAIDLDGGNNTYKYRGVLDIYTTYTLKFINDNLNNEFVFLRQHEYDKKALQLRDSNIDAIPKVYNKYSFKKVAFNYDETSQIWYGTNLGIKGNDLVNANKYYVFKDGINGGYKYFPILSKALDASVTYLEKNKSSLKYEGDFYNGKYLDFGTTRKNVNISDLINSNVVNAYRDGDIVEYYNQGVIYKYVFPAHTVLLQGWNKISNVPYGTLPIDVVVNTSRFNNAGAELQQGDFNLYVLGNLVYSTKHWNITSSKHGDLNNACREFLKLKVKIFNTTTQTRTIKVKNSLTGLEIYRKRTENINKFLGIYYLPHFLNFNKFSKEGDYIYIDINPQGDNIDYFNIYDYNMSNLDNQLNNTSYSTAYVLRYLLIKYYGNVINAEYRVNDMNKIFIGGKLFFTDTCNIISKSDDLISLDKSIITFPYQLPIGVDTYEQYVKANRGTTDTSFSIAKQQQDLNFAKSMFGGVMNFATSGIKAGANLLSGNVGGAVNSVLGGVTGVADTAFGIAGQIQGMNQMEQKIKAQYEQVNNTMGNELHFSNISNASLTLYYDNDEGEQYEGVEVSELDPNTLSLINNYIVLNGYLLPNKSTFDKKINNDRLFNYIQLDGTLLINQLNISYDNNKYNNEIYNLVTQQLTNGVRIWNRDGESIPEYNDNEPWPNQPTNTRPQIPPPQLPELPKTYEWNNFLYGTTYFDYYDQHQELKKGGCLLRVKKNSTNYVLDLQNNRTDRTCEFGNDYFTGGPTQIKLEPYNPTFVMNSKYGACKYQYGSDDTFYLVVGIADPNGLIVKLNIPHIESTIGPYQIFYDYSKHNVPPTTFVGNGGVSEIWVNGEKKWSAI